MASSTDRARAMREERALAVEAGDYLHRAEALAAWTKHLTAIRARLLAVPSRVGARTQPESPRAEVLALVEIELYDAMTEIADGKVRA